MLLGKAKGVRSTHFTFIFFESLGLCLDVGWGTFYIPLVKNFFNRCYYSLLRCHPGDWAHLATRYFEGSASFSPFGELTA
jgi:hypothetical protein